jgi:hypothetical protein
MATPRSTINWYTTATGGTSVATGTSFSTPFLSTTIYYVDATENNCTTVTENSSKCLLINYQRSQRLSPSAVVVLEQPQ